MRGTPIILAGVLSAFALVAAPARADPPAAAATPSISDHLPEFERLQGAGDWKGLEAAARAALANFETRLGPSSPQTAYAAEWVALALGSEGRFPEAESLLRRALRIIQTTSAGRDDPEVATALFYLGSTIDAENRHADAEPILRRALAIDEKVFGPDHLAVSRDLKGLGAALGAQGRNADAEPLFRRDLAIIEKTYGPEHPAVASSLSNLAVALTRLHRLDEAETVARRALAIDEKALGPDHPILARDLDNLAAILELLGRMPEEEPVRRRALAIEEKAVGADNPALLADLEALGGTLQDLDRYPEAEALFRREVAISEKATGPDNPATAPALIDVATILRLQGRYREAEAFARRALTIDEKAFGPKHMGVARALEALAYIVEGKSYSEAEALLRRALKIREALAPDDPDTAGVERNLAFALAQQGRNADAEALDQRALAADEKTFGGRGHPSVAADLSAIADIHLNEGDYPQAEALFRRALAIDEKALGADNSAVAADLNNLANALADLGHDTDAEPLMRRALEIGEKTLGPDHPMVADRLSNLADLLVHEGRYAEAEPLIRRALAITEKAFGPDQPAMALELDNLAQAVRSQGRPTEAETLFRRALAIDEKRDPNGPDIARDLDELAGLLIDLGRNKEAEALYRRELAISENARGPDHPDVAGNLNGLAGALALQGRYAEAAPLLRRALGIDEKNMGAESPNVATVLTNLGRLSRSTDDAPGAAAAYRKACRILRQSPGLDSASEDARETSQDSLANCNGDLSLSLWAWAAKGGGDKTDQPAALRAEAFQSGQQASANDASAALAQASARSLAEKSGVGDQAAHYEAALVELDELNQAFARAAADAKGDERQTKLNAQRDALEARIETLKAELKTKAPAYWDYRSPEPLKAEALQAPSGNDAKLLHPNEAVVLWLVAPGKDKGLVFAVSKTGFAWAEMGLDGADIEDRVENLRWRIDPSAFSRGAGRSEGGHAEPFDRAIAHELYVALLGDPKIQAVINGAGIDTLIVAPSGPLTSLPPSLLVVDAPQGRDDDPAALAATHWLIRDKALAALPAISSLRTLRQLLPASRSAPDRKLLALADPDFAGAGVLPEPPASPSSATAQKPLPGARAFERDGRGTDTLRTLPPLYGTLAEGRTLASVIDPGDPDALLLGPDASKTNLLKRAADGSLARTQVLVFSTHGLLTDDFSGLTEPALALAAPPKVGADPSDDGLLKASDAAALTLNADWVVLSACNTAGGQAKGADGLSGLARAFFHAGASTLLVSHWRVDDQATEQLITDTFRQRAAGKPKAKALQSAILQMLDEPARTHVEPRYWAPFVVVGEPE
ncbi:MAG TPA: tetratricopeptide repeat protein [Caulobacteraceae bacterium]